MRLLLRAVLAACIGLTASVPAVAQNATSSPAPVPGRTTITRSAENIPRMDVDCNARRENTTSFVRCVIRFDAPAVVTSVSAIDTARNTPWTPSFQPFNPQNDDTAFFVLVDTTDRARERTARKAATDLSQVFVAIGPRQRVAVASFAINMVVHQDFTSDPAKINSAFADIHAGGGATELYRHTIEAIRRLQAVPASRRVLIIAGTGNANDTAFTREEVEQAVRRTGVRVVSLGYFERDKQAPAIQMLERLSSPDASYRIPGPNHVLPEEFSRTILTRFGSGGVMEATLTPGEIPESLTTTMKFAPDNRERTFVAAFGGAAAAGTDGSARQPASQRAATASSYYDLLRNNTWQIAAGAGGLLAVLAALLLWRRSVRRKLATSTDISFAATPAADFSGDDRAPPPRAPPSAQTSAFDDVAGPSDRTPGAAPGPTRVELSTATAAVAERGERSRPIAYLEFNAAPGRYPVRKKHLTIGRHPDNDVVTDPRDDTVSRRHAVLAVNSDGRFQITNRSNEYRTERNPISVNGEVRDSAVLSDGDAVRLGTGNYGFVFREMSGSSTE